MEPTTPREIVEEEIARNVTLAVMVEREECARLADSSAVLATSYFERSPRFSGTSESFLIAGAGRAVSEQIAKRIRERTNKDVRPGGPYV